jgi:hypothetical protein
MKRLKGLFTDGDPVDQPPETYRDALNININDQVGAIATESGNEQYAQLPVGHIQLASILLADGRSVVLTVHEDGTESSIGVVTEDDYEQVIRDEDLNFDKNGVYQVTHKVNNRGETIIYWTDKVNPPRFLNITDPIDYTEIDELNLFAHISSPATLQIDRVQDFGGTLVSGSYQFTIRYLDDDGNTTNFLDITPPISVVRDKQNSPAGFVQGNPTAATSKSIRLFINNLDQNYDRFQLGVIRHEGSTVAGVQLLQPRAITQESTPFVYSGNEDSIDGSIEEVLINNVHYDSAGSITQSDGVLYLGDLKKDQSLNLQSVANDIEAHLVSKDIEYSEGGYWAHGNETTAFFSKSFKRGEVYAFYVSFLLNTGEETQAFHIPGRAATGTETDSPPSNVPSAFSDAKNFHFYAPKGENGLGYWENEEENYPQDADVWGGLAGQPVRHHRIPDAQSHPFVIDSGNQWYSHINVLGIQFKNIVIPEEYNGIIKGVKFYYAKKDVGDRLILDQALATPEEVYEDFYKTFLLWKNESPSVLDVDSVSLVPFSTMVRNLSLASVSYLRKVGTYKLDSITWYENEDGVPDRSEDNGFAILNNQSIQDRYADDSILEVEAIAKIPAEVDEVQITNLGFNHNKNARGNHSHVLAQVDRNMNFPVGWDQDNDTNVIMEMCQLLKNVHAPFDQQELVPLGETLDDIDNLFADAPTTGAKATGSITVGSDATAEAGGGSLAITDTITLTGTLTSSLNIRIASDDPEIDDFTLFVESGTTADNVAGMLEFAIGGADLPYNLVRTDTNAFYLEWKVAENINYTVSIEETLNDGPLDGSEGLTATPLSTSFTGGAAGDVGKVGDLLIRINASLSNFLGDIAIAVGYGDTRTDIADKIASNLNNNAFSSYTATVDDSGTNPVVNMEAKQEGKDTMVTLLSF